MTIGVINRSSHKNLLLEKNDSFTLLKIGFFGAAHGLGTGAKRTPPFPKTCHTNPSMMKLGRSTPFVKKIQEIYESRDTTADASIFYQPRFEVIDIQLSLLFYI